MLMRLFTGFLLTLLITPAHSDQTFITDEPKSCFSCEEWNQPQQPFQIFGNTYYVGTAGLTAILITSDAGLVLIDGALSQSAELIDANIRRLGFDTRDIKLILNSHAHYDHVGGIAALQRATGASVMASPESAKALLRGGPTIDDPQYGFSEEANRFPKIENVQTIHDRQIVTVGDIALTAYFTPGHTPGGTTWVWRSCTAGECLDIVYADSLNPISAPDFRFFDADAAFDYRTILLDNVKLFKQLDCDILLSPHPFYFAMRDKLERWQSEPDKNPFIDSQACRQHARAGEQYLHQRIEFEAAPE